MPKPRLKSAASLSDAPSPEHPAGLLAEVFAETAADGAVTGFALAHLPTDRGPILWVQDRLSMREAGRPCHTGLPPGLDVLHLSVSRPVDVLWALEQGLGNAALGGLIGEIWGDPPALDFTATKRLALRAEARGLSCWILRRAASADLSAARERWRVSSLPSARKDYDSRAPGAPLWRADLFRARWRATGEWVARPHETGTGVAFEHGSLAEVPAPDTQSLSAAG